MNHSPHDFDLILVGSGLVGASLACALVMLDTGRQLRIAMIEAGGDMPRYNGGQFDPRVVALTPASRHWLERLQVWEAIRQARACAYRDMHVWDGEGTAAIHFSSADVRQDCLGHIVENSVAVRALRERLTQLPQVEVMQPVSIVELRGPQPMQPGVQVTLSNGDTLQAPLLVAADGAQSRVREMAAFRTREWDYQQQAIVTTVRTSQSHEHTAWQRFMYTGPLAFLPLQEAGDTHHCSIVWSADTPLAEELMALDAAAFCERLGFAFEHRLGNIEHCAERFCVPLRQRHAQQYCQPGIVLVGDAAHNIHPLAGQGVNLGLLDAAALTNEIERALVRNIPLADYSILRRYQRQRLAGNLGMMSAMEGFKRLFGHRSLEVTLLRNIGLQTFNDLPLLKNYLVKQVMGV